MACKRPLAGLSLFASSRPRPPMHHTTPHSIQLGLYSHDPEMVLQLHVPPPPVALPARLPHPGDIARQSLHPEIILFPTTSASFFFFFFF